MVEEDPGVKNSEEIQIIRDDVNLNWAEFRDLVGHRREELLELRLLKLILDERLVEAEAQLSNIKIILNEEDTHDIVNVKRRLDRHNTVKLDIDSLASELKTIIVTVEPYRSSSKTGWRQVFIKIQMLQDQLIIVFKLEEIKGTELNALQENVAYFRDIKYIDRWLRENGDEALSKETGEDLDQNEELTHTFVKLHAEFELIREKLNFVILYSNSESSLNVKDKLKDLKDRFDIMEIDMDKREARLRFAAILHKFHADGLGILLWIRENESIINDPNIGDDLYSATKLLKGVEKLEPHIQVTSNKVSELKDSYKSIKENYPKKAPKAAEKLENITTIWPEMDMLYEERTNTLKRSVDEFKCYSDLQKIKDDLQDLSNQADDDRNGKTIVNFQNSERDLSMLQDKLSLLKDEIEDLYIPEEMDVRENIAQLTESAEDVNSLLQKSSNKVNFESKVAELYRNIANIKSWINLENRKNLNKKFDMTREFIESELQSTTEVLENIKRKEDLLVLAGKDVIPMADKESANDFVDEDELNKAITCKENISTELAAMKESKENEAETLEKMLTCNKFLEVEESYKDWIDVKSMEISSLLAENPTELNNSIFAIDIYEKELLTKEANFQTSMGEIENFVIDCNKEELFHADNLITLTESNEKDFGDLRTLHDNRKEYLLKQDQILKLEQLTSAMEEWVDDKTVHVDNIAFEADLLHVNFCNKLVNELETLLPAQLKKLEDAGSDISSLNVTPDLEKNFDRTLEKYVDLEKKFKFKKKTLDEWTTGLRVKQWFELTRTWITENEPNLIDGYIGSDFNEAERLYNKYNAFLKSVEQQTIDFDYLNEEFSDLTPKMKSEVLPEQQDTMRRWKNFQSLLDARKQNLVHGLEMHKILTEANVLKDTAIDKLQILLSVGNEATLWAVQITKKKLHTIEEFIPTFETYIHRLKLQFNKFYGELMICSKELHSNYMLSLPFTIRDLPADAVKEFKKGTKVTLVYPFTSQQWKCSITTDGTTCLYKIPASILEHDPDLDIYKAKSIISKLHFELLELLEKLKVSYGNADKKISSIYNKLLLGESNTENLEWIQSVDDWVKSEHRKLPTDTMNDFTVMISLCDNYEKEAGEREDLLKEVETEITDSVVDEPDTDFHKVKYVLDNLKYRYKTLDFNLKTLKTDGEERLEFLKVQEELGNIGNEADTFRDVIVNMDEKPDGIPKEFEELSDKYHKDFDGAMEKINDLTDREIGISDTIDNDVHACKSSLDELSDAINGFNTKCSESKILKDYVEKANKLNEKIGDMNDEFDDIDVPIIEEGNINTDYLEPILDVAEEELAEIVADKEKNLDPPITDFVFNGIGLIHEGHPKRDRIKEVCENVQDNFENLEARIKAKKKELDAAKNKLNDVMPDEIDAYVQYLADVISSPLFQNDPKTEDEMKRGSMLLEKGEYRLDRLRKAAAEAEKEGRPMDKIRDVITKISNEYDKRQKDIDRKYKENEFVISANQFREWCELTLNDNLALLNKKNFESIKHVLDLFELDIEQSRPEYQALVATGESIVNDPALEEESNSLNIPKILEGLNSCWLSFEEGRDMVKKLKDVKRLQMLLKADLSEIELWVFETQSSISQDQWEPDVNLIQMNKKAQGEFLIRKEVYEKKLVYLESVLDKLRELDSDVAGKLSNRFNNLMKDVEDLKLSLKYRKEVLEDWERVIYILPIIAYESSWIDDEILRMDIDWIPSSNGDALIKIRKLTKLKNGLQKRGMNSLPGEIPRKLELVNRLLDDMEDHWNELLEMINEADAILIKYERFFVWKTNAILFIADVRDLLSQIDPNVEERSVPSLIQKSQKITNLLSTSLKFDEEHREIMDGSVALERNGTAMDEEITSITSNVDDVYRTMKKEIKENKILISNLLERAKFVTKVEESISYDSTTKKKILVLDRCNDITLASKRLKQFLLLEDKISASADALKKSSEEYNILELQEGEVNDVFPVKKHLERANDFHKELVLQATSTKNKILANLDVYSNILDKLFFRYSKLASDLSRWIEDVEEFATDGVFSMSLDEANCLQEPFAELEQEVVDKKKLLDELNKVDREIKGYGFYQNPYTWMTFQQVEMCWRNVQNKIREHGHSISNEYHRQETNDMNERTYADYANQLFDKIVSMKEDCVRSSSYYPEEKRNYLIKRKSEIAELKEQLRILDVKLGQDTGRMTVNHYTEHSVVRLEHELGSLQELVKKLLHRIETELAVIHEEELTQGEMAEIRSSFYYFDTDKTKNLDYDEFKLCLMSLGYDLTTDDGDVKYKAILDVVDIDKGGFVEIEEFVQFMLSKRGNAIITKGDLDESFKALTSDGDKDYIIPKEIESKLQPAVAKYCLAKMDRHKGHGSPVGALDYEAFTEELFKSLSSLR